MGVHVFVGRGGARAHTHHVVQADTPALKQDLAREPIDKGKPELEHKEEGMRGTTAERKSALGNH